MKKIFRIVLKILLLVLILWLVVAQSCMRFRIPDTEAVADFKKAGVVLHTNTITISDYHLHYVSSGNDSLPILVFIHGSPGSWNNFEDYLKDNELLQKFHMVSIDRPGFGYSDFGNAEHMNEQAKQISVLLHRIKNNKPMYLVGHSLGGPMVVALTYYNPDLINGLVMLAGCVDPAEEKKEEWRSVMFYPPMRYFIPGIQRPSNDELVYFKEDVLQMPHMLSQIKCKAIILQGDHDPVVPYINAVYAKAKMTNAQSVELITLKGADHSIPWTNFSDIKKVLMHLN